jgi:hypothetical protein
MRPGGLKKMIDRFYGLTKTEATERAINRNVSFPIDGSTTCWEWVGHKDRFGYGVMKIRSKPKLAHRMIFEYFKSINIPDGMCVLHSCDHPWCVNPYHLRLGTHAENMKDLKIRKRNKLSLITHCKNGHEFSGRNLILRKSEGSRQCRACLYESHKRCAERRAQKGIK